MGWQLTHRAGCTGGGLPATFYVVFQLVQGPTKVGIKVHVMSGNGVKC